MAAWSPVAQRDVELDFLSTGLDVQRPSSIRRQVRASRSSEPFSFEDATSTAEDRRNDGKTSQVHLLPDDAFSPHLEDDRSLRYETTPIVVLLAWWIPELVSSLLSVVTLLGIIVVLRIYDGRPVSALHLPPFLTINGLVAALATLNRAFLTAPACSAILQEMWLFLAHEARRPPHECSSRLKDLELFTAAATGAWGSLVFIVNARGARFVTVLGCLIVIISLAYSTFTQQLLGMHLAPSTTNMTSVGSLNLPRSEVWAQWGGTEFDALSSFDPGLDMIGALYTGMLAEGVQPLQPSCPTGNCTWPVSPSMAVCGQCANSTFVQTSCNGTSCEYALPSGSTTTLFNFQSYGDVATNPNITAPGFQVVPGAGAIFDSTAQDRLYIMNIELFGAPYWSFADQNPTLSNYECALWLCINAYNASVSSTVQNLTVTESFSNFNTSWLNMNVSGLAFYGGTWYQFPELPATMNAGDVVYRVNLWAHMALQQYLYTAINGTVYWGQSQHFSNDLIRGIWNGTTNLDAWIGNVAMSMSNVVRSTNVSSRAEYDGAALELVIQIRWQWLILPAALVLASILYLLAVMIRTAYSSVESWKGSPLTLLLSDLDETTRLAARGQGRRHHAVLSAIGNARVRLTSDEGGGRKFHAL